MEPEPIVLDSLRKAVEAMPDDVPLRLHLATMLPRPDRGTRRSGSSARCCSATRATPGRSACCGVPAGEAGASQPPAGPPVISPERPGPPRRRPAPPPDAGPAHSPGPSGPETAL